MKKFIPANRKQLEGRRIKPKPEDFYTSIQEIKFDW